MSTPLKIVRLDVDGFKRIKAVSIQPNGEPIVEIRGRNAQGKSSVLDAFEAALVGKDAFPARPVHGDGKRAEIRVYLAGNSKSLLVERTIRPDGKHTLKIQSADPNQPQSQAWLDEQIGQISFDPYTFIRMKPAAQAAELRAALGIDTTALDVARQEAFEERTLVNREHKRLEGALALAEYPDGPDEPVAVGALLRQLEAANEQKRVNAEARAELAAAVRELASLDARVLDLKRLLAEAEKTRNATAERLAVMERVGEGRPDPDTLELERQIREAQSVNEAVRMRESRRLMAEEVDAKRREADALTDRIEEIDVAKKAMLTTASFPMPGVSMDDNGVYLNGEPIEQASQAERIRFAVALGLALNPNIRVLLVRDGSLLDEDALALIGQMAQEAGAQVLVERVGREGAGWLIEDGELTAVDGAPVEQVAP